MNLIPFIYLAVELVEYDPKYNKITLVPREANAAYGRFETMTPPDEIGEFLNGRGRNKAGQIIPLDKNNTNIIIEEFNPVITVAN